MSPPVEEEEDERKESGIGSLTSSQVSYFFFCPVVSLVLLKSDPFLSATRASFPLLLLLSFFRFIVVVVAQKTGSGSIRSISH